MKAIILNESGNTDKLQYTNLETPVISENEVLVKVKAISINPVDVKTRSGKGVYGRLKDQKPFILGWDISGEITKVGDEVSEFSIGDQVFGMVNFPGHGQAYAEYVAVPTNHLALKPSNISHEEAAAATLAALTAYQAIVHQAKVKAGDRVLIHAAAGGVGHFAVQIAKKIGAYVIGTASANNRDFLLELGVDEHIDYRSVRFEEATSDIDFVLDAIGGENIDRSLEVTKKGGTVISIPSGLNELVTEKAKEKGINGFFFLVQSNGADMNAIAKLLEQRKIKAHVSASFTFEEMAAAHKQVETGKTRGKVVVTIG